tara:strand:- start:255 stop:683 length:429 start_codon:yes stop_codon:yes gene_type:complete
MNPARKNYGKRDDYQVGDFVMVWGKSTWGAYRVRKIEDTTSGSRYVCESASKHPYYALARDLRPANAEEEAHFPNARKIHNANQKTRRNDNRQRKENLEAQKVRVREILEEYGVPASSPMWRKLSLETPSGFTHFLNTRAHK